MARILFFLLLLYCSLDPYCAEAQDDDSTEVAEVLPPSPFPDSIFKFNTRTPSAKRAGLYSALLPGLGQVYNKQYWKLAVIAAASGIVGGFVVYNSRKYQVYQKAYFGRIDNDPGTTDTFSVYELEDIDLLRKTYRTYLEYSIIAGSLSYLVNILDAFTSAHLKSFDMDKNISMRILPYYDQRRQVGIRILVAKK